MGKLTLLLGGARSGKSTYAQRLAADNGGSVTFIATAKAGDPEMAARIAAHQHERPGEWVTLESASGIADAWNATHHPTDMVILDCLTLLVTNLILQASEDIDHPDESKATALVTSEIEALERAIQEGACDWIVVSNEVGLGLVPAYPVGRLFRDLLGWSNQRLAAIADEVHLLVAGIPLPLHNYRDI
jgi:adenosylcobinamide kinase/adenosylcobinamide-phosphate guanylyltransferase